MTLQNLNSTIGKYYASQFQSGNQTIKTEITEEEYNRIAETNKAIRRMLYFKNKALECKLNLLDYFKVVEQYSVLIKDPEEVRNKFNLEYTQTDINRVFNNFVISFKSLTENSEKMITRIYTENSYEFKEYKGFTAHLYDSLFPYRLFTRLRDYTVHYSQPINLNINFNEQTEISLDPHLRKSQLIRFRDIKRKLTMDLRSFEENFSVEPLMNELAPFIDLFYPMIVRILSNSEQTKFEELLSFYRNYKTSDEKNMSLATPKDFINNRLDLNFIILDIPEALNIEKILT